MIDGGRDLKVERVRAGATQQEIGRHMGISAARVSVIERGAAVEPDTAARYRAAVEQIKQEQSLGRESTTRFDLSGVAIDGSAVDHYRFARGEARRHAKKEPWVRTVEIVLHNHSHAATLLGYLDGYSASGVSCRVLDKDGTIVNRRVG